MKQHHRLHVIDPKIILIAGAQGPKRGQRPPLRLLGRQDAGPGLRLEARDQRLEFRPEPDGIVAVFMNGNDELRREPVNLEASPDPLIASWMTTL